MRFFFYGTLLDHDVTALVLAPKKDRPLGEMLSVVPMPANPYAD